MLTCVLILALVATIFSIGLIPALTQNSVSATAKLLEQQLNIAQTCALTTKQKASVKILENTIEVNCEQYLQTVKYDRNVTIKTNIPNNVITYNQNGGINQAGTINICNRTTCQKMTLSIGRSKIEYK